MFVVINEIQFRLNYDAFLKKALLNDFFTSLNTEQEMEKKWYLTNTPRGN